jgi:Na+-driven multidrug efflux pump
VLLSTAINTYFQATTTFTSQNYGAKKPERMRKSIIVALIQASVIGIVVGQLMIIFHEPLVNMYLAPDDPNRESVLGYAKQIMTVMLSSYFIGAMVDSMSGFLRGLGASISSMMICMLGVCGVRCAWIFFAFPQFGTLTSLYIVYPISWTITFTGLSIVAIFVYKRVKRKIEEERKERETLAEAAAETV